jgi:probable F420-dependent oxidoreductase
MRLGVRLPYHTPTISADELRRVAVAADQAGFHSGWVGDHIVFPAGHSDTVHPNTRDGKYPRPYDEPTLEAWTTLAYVAAVTQRIRLSVGVCILPYRNPLILAKVIATLDLLSNGRVMCGVGIGWLEEEFDALQVSFARRRARLIDGVELLRRCWASSPVDYDGPEFSTAGPVHFAPTPARRIPIFMGGHSPPALARAVELGDGWFGHDLTVPETDAIRRQLEHAAGQGLPEQFDFMVSRLINPPGCADPVESALSIGSAVGLADEFARYEEAGVDLLMCDCTERSGAALERLIAAAQDAGARRGLLE